MMQELRDTLCSENNTVDVLNCCNPGPIDLRYSNKRNATCVLPNEEL